MCKLTSRCLLMSVLCARLRWWTRRRSACVVSTSWMLTSTLLCFGTIICLARNMFSHLNLHDCMRNTCQGWGNELWSFWLARLRCHFSSVLQGSYRSWKVLEFYCSEFQALESPGKRHRSWKSLENPGKSWNCKPAVPEILVLVWVVAKQISNSF